MLKLALLIEIKLLYECSGKNIQVEIRSYFLFNFTNSLILALRFYWTARDFN